MTVMNEEKKIALFLDFENIAFGVRDAKYEQFEIGLVLERLVEKGKVLVKRAYGNWIRHKEYRRPLHEAAIEMIEIPERRYSGKNSADIKLVVDAMDLCYSKEHMDTFVIASGDSDFSPLVSKLRENGKFAIGIGVKNSTSQLLVENCDEFIFYEDLVREKTKPSRLENLPKKQAQAFGLVISAIRALEREAKETI
ncbi:MAG: NYN domain-containing protein, partial [Planctomycetota bacterium]